MKFLLENKDIFFDFQYELFRQQDYNKWLNKGRSEELQTELIVITERDARRYDWDFEPREWCPVGSVEFCLDWYKKYWNKEPRPRNVPKSLIPFQCRKITENTLEGLRGESFFIKSSEKIKDENNGEFLKTYTLPFKRYQASEIIPKIKSEWRCFIYSRNLVDIKNYSGDPFMVPNKIFIEKMIKEFKEAPVSYTLDVAVCSEPDGYYSELIEVHDFFSCGLYGFNDSKYPGMLWKWFKEFTK